MLFKHKLDIKILARKGRWRKENEAQKKRLTKESKGSIEIRNGWQYKL